MSSISPESSASQQVPAGAELVVQPFDLAGFAEILRVAQSEGKVDVDALTNRFIGAYHAYLRSVRSQSGLAVGLSEEVRSATSSPSVNSRTVSSSGGSVSSGFKNLASARYHSLRSKVSWRQPEVSVLDDGYCYLQAVRLHKRDDVKNKLGAWPTMFSLLSLPRSQFRPEKKLQCLRLDGSATTGHIARGGKGYPLFSAMVDIASKSCVVADEQSMYATLRTKTNGIVTSFRGSTQVGGIVGVGPVHPASLVCARPVGLWFLLDQPASIEVVEEKGVVYWWRIQSLSLLPGDVVIVAKSQRELDFLRSYYPGHPSDGFTLVSALHQFRGKKFRFYSSGNVDASLWDSFPHWGVFPDEHDSDIVRGQCALTR